MAKRNYGYITNKERDKRVRQSNQSYGLRKIFISVTVASLIILVVFTIIAAVTYGLVIKEFGINEGQEGLATELITQLSKQPFSLFSVTVNGKEFTLNLSAFGWFMAIWALVTIGLSIASLFLVLLMKSPKAAKANLNRLQSAALSGKKLDKGVNAAQVYRDRATNTKRMKKIEAQRKNEDKHKFDWTKKAKKNKKDKKKK